MSALMRRPSNVLAAGSTLCLLLLLSLWGYAAMHSHVHVLGWRTSGGAVEWKVWAEAGNTMGFYPPAWENGVHVRMTRFFSVPRRPPTHEVNAQYTWAMSLPSHSYFDIAGFEAKKHPAFDYERYGWSCLGYSTSIAIPLWPFAILFSIIPLTRYMKGRRAKRAVSVGRCAVCGYDLRATPDRCPECGTAVGPAA
jgi:hypothetical protein